MFSYFNKEQRHERYRQHRKRDEINSYLYKYKTESYEFLCEHEFYASEFADEVLRQIFKIDGTGFVLNFNYQTHSWFYGETPLIAAVFACKELSVVETLLQAGADLEYRRTSGHMDDKGNTALTVACKRNVRWLSDIKLKSDLIRLLIDAGADINGKGTKGATPLMVACDNTLLGDEVSLLIDAGAEVDATDDEGQTALMRCITSTFERKLYPSSDDCDPSTFENQVEEILSTPPVVVDLKGKFRLTSRVIEDSATDQSWVIYIFPNISSYLLLQAGADLYKEDSSEESAIYKALTVPNMKSYEILGPLKSIALPGGRMRQVRHPSTVSKESVFNGKGDEYGLSTEISSVPINDFMMNLVCSICHVNADISYGYTPLTLLLKGYDNRNSGWWTEIEPYANILRDRGASPTG